MLETQDTLSLLQVSSFQLGPDMQGADAAQGHVLPARMPCIVQANLGSVASSDILLQSVSLEQSGASSAATPGAFSTYLAPLACSLSTTYGVVLLGLLVGFSPATLATQAAAFSSLESGQICKPLLKSWMPAALGKGCFVAV